MAGDDVGVVRLAEAVQHAPARPKRDLGGAAERGHQRRHVARARRVVLAALGRLHVHHRAPHDGAGRGRGASARAFTRSRPTTSMSALVAALSETASIRMSRSASVSAVPRIEALEQPSAAGRGRLRRPVSRRPASSAPSSTAHHMAAEISTFTVLAAGIDRVRRFARPGGRSPGRWRRRRSVFGLVHAPNGAHARLEIRGMRLVRRPGPAPGSRARSGPRRSRWRCGRRSRPGRRAPPGGATPRGRRSPAGRRCWGRSMPEAAMDGLHEARAVEALDGERRPTRTARRGT